MNRSQVTWWWHLWHYFAGEDLLAIAADQPFRFPATLTFVLEHSLLLRFRISYWISAFGEHHCKPTNVCSSICSFRWHWQRAWPTFWYYWNCQTVSLYLNYKSIFGYTVNIMGKSHICLTADAYNIASQLCSWTAKISWSWCQSCFEGSTLDVDSFLWQPAKCIAFYLLNT